MSKLDELISELCPDGVEFVELNEVLDYEQSTKYIVKSTNYDDSYTIPVLTAGQSFLLGYTNEDFGIYQATPENPVIIFDDFTTSFHWIDFRFKVKSSAMKMLKPRNKEIANFRFLFHTMRNINYIPVDHTRQWIEKYSKFKIPLPPLPVQREIVRILDNFTELTAELTTELKAEIEAREKQYEYYRDWLLNDVNKDTVKWISLKECTLPTSNIKWSLEDESTTYKYIDLTSVDRDLHYIIETQEINKNNAPSRAQQIVETGDILFATTRPLLKRYCLINSEYDEQICSTGFCVLRANPDIVLQKWILYHIASSSFYSYVEKYQQGASYPAISDTSVKNYQIPVPPLEEQERIVAILDRFDALCNDLTSGLPAEIEARQKQYEYYRDKLLSFKEVSS